jgi:hypothetical protein
MESATPLSSGSTLFDKTGSKIGTITDVIFDSITLQPEWYDVKVGMLGGHHLLPARTVTVEGDHGVVPFEKKVIKSAPRSSTPPVDKEKRSLMAHYRAA